MRSLQSDSSWRVRNLPGCHQLNWSRRNSAETLAGLASELTPRRIADSTIAGSALDRPCGNYARHGGDIRLMQRKIEAAKRHESNLQSKGPNWKVAAELAPREELNCAFANFTTLSGQMWRSFFGSIVSCVALLRQRFVNVTVRFLAADLKVSEEAKKGKCDA